MSPAQEPRCLAPGRSRQPLLLGVVHLLALPGGPGPSAGLAAVLERARRDAQALAAGGVDGIIVENLGDAPFEAEHVDAFTIAAMTLAAREVRGAMPEGLLGVNVLRNDALAALAIAAATGAEFIRVNVHVGTMVTDQGLITGRARQTLMARARLGVPVGIAADVLVKHATPLGTPDAAQLARDTLHRGRADALIVTGSGTGRPVDPALLDLVRAAVPDAALWVGSGLTPDSAPEVRERIDGAIVGTWMHEDGDLDQPVAEARVRAVRAALIG